MAARKAPLLSLLRHQELPRGETWKTWLSKGRGVEGRPIATQECRCAEPWKRTALSWVPLGVRVGCRKSCICHVLREVSFVLVSVQQIGTERLLQSRHRGRCWVQNQGEETGTFLNTESHRLGLGRCSTGSVEDPPGPSVQAGTQVWWGTSRPCGGAFRQATAGPHHGGGELHVSRAWLLGGVPPTSAHDGRAGWLMKTSGRRR